MPPRDHPCARVRRGFVMGVFRPDNNLHVASAAFTPHLMSRRESRKLAAMPELPEVETTRRGLAPHLEGRIVADVVLRRPDLRWPIPPKSAALLPGQRIDSVRRRAKYLLLDTEVGSALLHLGHVRQPARPARRHAGGGARPRRPRPRRPRAHEGPRPALQRPAALRLPALAAARAKSTNSCAASAPNRCPTPSTATTSSPAAAAAKRR